MPTQVLRRAPDPEPRLARYGVVRRVRRLRLRHPRWFRVCVAASAGAVMLFAWFLLKPIGPDDIAKATVAALRSRDVDTLLALTLPEERRRLNLSRSSVQRFLDETMWNEPALPRMEIEQLEGGLPDEIVYRVSSSSTDPTHHFPFRVMAIQSPDGCWHLALGNLLVNAAFVRGGWRDSMYSNRLWVELCRATGIVGYHENHTGYWRINPDGRTSRMDPVE